MDISEIETFLMIVNTKSISKTAELLFLTQPTVSHRLKILESELNVKLIMREKGHKGITLTNKGEEFIPIAQRWLSLWKETQALQDQKEKQFLTIGSTDSLNGSLLSPFYRSILMEEPCFDLRIRTHQSDEIYDLLSAYKIDIGFVYHHLSYKNVVAQELFSEKMYLVQSPDTAIQKKEIHTDELDPEKELFFSWETNYQIWHDQWIGNTVRPHIQIDSITLLNELWQEGQMWMIAPYSIIQMLQQKSPVFISELYNQPPNRIAYKLTNKSPKKNTKNAVMYLEQKLETYLAEHSFDR